MIGTVTVKVDQCPSIFVNMLSQHDVNIRQMNVHLVMYSVCSSLFTLSVTEYD